MKIVFIGAVKFSEKAFKKMIDIKSNIVVVCTLKNSSFNSDHGDLSLLSRNFNIPVRYAPNINSEGTIKWINHL